MVPITRLNADSAMKETSISGQKSKWGSLENRAPNPWVLGDYRAKMKEMREG